MHWIPTTKQSPATVDRFVAEAQRMGVKWVTFLNDGATISDNDYLVSKLVGAGIEPVMRVYSPTIAPLSGDIEGMVRHYTGMGVHYFQPFNEPNLNCENPDGKVSVDRYLDAWVPAAQAIVRGGGLPGFGSMAPGGDFDDQVFLQASLDGLKSRGQLGALDNSWLSMHNYTWNHPIEDRGDGDGFFKFRAYDTMVRKALGRDMPIIGTEGGTFEGQQEDPKCRRSPRRWPRTGPATRSSTCATNANRGCWRHRCGRSRISPAAARIHGLSPRHCSRPTVARAPSSARSRTWRN